MGHVCVFVLLFVGVLVGSIILLPRFSRWYFRRQFKRMTFVPVFNLRGEVIRKYPMQDRRLRTDAQNLYLVVRIAVTAYHMLYLMTRPPSSIHEEGKADLPLEGYMILGEHIGQTARRILHERLPQLSPVGLHYHCMYHYRDDMTHRLVCLCTLELENDDLLPHEGKLWTLGQIQQNLGKHYLSKYLEYEFDSLKHIICTREKCMES